MGTELKSFYAYTDDELTNKLPKGGYHLKALELEVGNWENGDPNLNMTTQVVSGEKAGMFGPRHTWSVEEFVGTNSTSGNEFTITKERNCKDLIRDVRAIRDGKDIILSQPDSYDEAMLKEIARQIKGDEFTADVTEDKNGWPRIRRFGSMTEPVKSFNGAEVAKAFNLDDV